MEEQSQSRRTNILVGDEILTQIAESPCITHENGVMTINLSSLPNPAKIGNVTITALRDGAGDHLLVTGQNLDAALATLQNIYDLAALKTDLANYATKTDLAGVAVTWDNLTGKPTTYPARYCMECKFPGTLAVGQSVVSMLPGSINVATLKTIHAISMIPWESGATGGVRFGVKLAAMAYGYYEWGLGTISPSPIFQDALSQPSGVFNVPALRQAGTFQTSDTFSDGDDYYGNVAFKVTVEEIPVGATASDGVVIFEFLPEYL